MNNQFEILIRSKKPIKSRQWWSKEIKKALRVLEKNLKDQDKKKVRKYSFLLLLTNKNEIQNLNKKYRNKNKPTDVLSFYLSKANQLRNKYLGDVIICEEVGLKQSTEKKVPVENELILLFIHGYLHLLGYDHIKSKDAKVMFGIQNKILKEFIY